MIENVSSHPGGLLTDHTENTEIFKTKLTAEIFSNVTKTNGLAETPKKTDL